MRKEIDILLQAAGKECVVVEKATHLVWSMEELRQAQADAQFQQADEIREPEQFSPINAPFPGCLQFGGDLRRATAYRQVGQTSHFVILAAIVDELTARKS